VQRIAVVSDVHSNLQALEAVLARIDHLGCDTVWCLGDVVGYGARPSECLALLRDRGTVFVQGNHDAAVADVAATIWFNLHSRLAVEHNRRLLTAAEIDFLAALPTRRDLEDGTVLCHGSPGDRDRYLLDTNLLEEVRLDQEAERGAGLTWFGHTHQPVWHLDRPLPLEPGGPRPVPADRRVLVNPGSVGQPRDGDPRSSFGFWDREAGEMVLERVEYDLEAARTDILDAGLPRRLGDRLRSGL
jgi:predicted phosphodiesterase